MVHRMKIVCLILFTIFVYSCATKPNVFVDSDPSHDFSGYKTFSWTVENPMVVQSDYTVSPFVGQRIMSEIRTTMEQKGYTFTSNRDAADFAIMFTVGARDKIKVTTEPAIIHSSWGWGYQYWGTQVINVNRNVPYVEGTLAIDVFDLQKQSPVWHGVGAKRLNSEERKGSNSGIPEAVKTILASFPVA